MMTVVTDKVTRFATDLIESATIEGARQSRSSKQQLDHWTRVGRAVSEHPTIARRHVEAALAGELPFHALDAPERVVANAEIDARIEENLRATEYGEELLTQGISIVAVNDAGVLVRYLPDGTTTPLADLVDTCD